MSNRTDKVKELFEAFSNTDRDTVEKLYAPQFTFSAPPDPLLDRAGFFERCWPGQLHEYKFVHVIEQGDAVVVAFESEKPDGTWARNLDVITFVGDQIARIEVYFGWDLKDQPQS